MPRMQVEPDRAALDALIAPHLDELRAAARRLAGSAEDADDLLQETAAAALEGLHGLRNRDLLGAWLLQILRRKWVDLLRRRVRERSLNVRGDLSAPARAGGSDLAEQAMAVLDPGERRIVELRYFESRTSAEISVLVGKPAGTVRSILFHALNKIEAECRRLGRMEDA